MIQKDNSQPKSEPLSRVWFMARGYKQTDPRYTDGEIVWLHPKTNDVLSKYGTKLTLLKIPYEKYKANTTQYLKLPNGYGSMYLARLKYLTFKGEIKPGHNIDHIDGDTFNNDIRNLRAVPQAINFRDGGFMRKMRNNGYPVAKFPGIILEGYERMAQWKAEHTERQYTNLKGRELLQVFLGPNFPLGTPDCSAEPLRDFDPFCERDDPDPAAHLAPLSL